MTFTAFSLHESLQRAITAAGYTTPTPIQASAIPVALTGTDLLGTAQTGTGKTAAFVLPLLHRLLATPGAARQPRALVLTPTRELAEQVHDAVCQLGQYTDLRSATIYGGVGMEAQTQALKRGTEILVACPGRLLDHVGRRQVDLSRIECLVLDEADRMLDMGFMPDVRRIIGLLPAARQTMLFSATFPPALNHFVRHTLREPERIEVDAIAPATTISHAIYPVPSHLKTALLLAMLYEAQSDAVLIFSRTKHGADRIATHLQRAGFTTGVLHSDRTQVQRQKALDAFRAGKVRCLVATDIAARGIDVTGISHVINYDIPETADAYIHRIGRTGRAERTGEAYTLTTMDDLEYVRAIERALGERLETRVLPTFNYAQARTAADEASSRGVRNSRYNPGRFGKRARW